MILEFDKTDYFPSIGCLDVVILTSVFPGMVCIFTSHVVSVIAMYSYATVSQFCPSLCKSIAVSPRGSTIC